MKVLVSAMLSACSVPDYLCVIELESLGPIFTSPHLFLTLVDSTAAVITCKRFGTEQLGQSSVGHTHSLPHDCECVFVCHGVR